MIAIPILNIRSGLAPHLGGVDPASSASRGDDVVSVARRLAAIGFPRLHVEDLESATRRGDNQDAIRSLLRHTPLPIQIGVPGPDATTLLARVDEGADWVVAAAAEIDDIAELADCAELADGRLMLGLTLTDRTATLRARGARRLHHRDVLDLIGELDGLVFDALVVSFRNRDTGSEAELAVVEDIVGASPWPVLVRCTADSLQGLRNLDHRGVEGVVLALSSDAGALAAHLIAEEFGP